ncbi:N-acetylmuramoyl-L-alanine amidase [Bacillus sp. JJ722]|uniref:N-acetylmuramoyl-L-alanine amidase n=1 Tax=Bacillus sp. JJ722 TaxID=3122973 RepID=UPI002FFE3EE3
MLVFLKWTDAHGVETYVYKDTLKEAVKVAKAVQKSIVNATGLRDRGVKEDNLHMLRETNPTSILVEGPFMSNRKK